MIQIIPIQQVTDAVLVACSPNLVHLKRTQAFKKERMGCFIMLKATQIIGYGVIEPSVNAPLTAGIGQLNHYFIMPSERQQGYGTQLFHHLLQFAKKYYGLLELPTNCPWRKTQGNQIDLFNI